MSAVEAQSANFGTEGGNVRRNVTLAWLTGVFALNFLDRQILSLFAQPIKTEFVLTDTQVALLYGFGFAVLYGTAGFPIARMADRGGRIRIVGLALLLFSTLTAACALVTASWQLVAVRIGVALSESGTNPPSHSLIADLYRPNERSAAMAVFSVGPNIGLLFGFVGLGWIGGHYGWRAAFATVGVVGVLVSIFGFLRIREPSHDRGVEAVERTSTVRALKLAFRTASSRHIFVGATAFSLTSYAILGWLPSMLVREGLSIPSTGLALSLILGLAGGCGTLFGGIASDRFAAGRPAVRLRILALVLAISAPLWIAVFLSQSVVITLALLIFPAATMGFYLGPTFATMQSLVDPGVRSTSAAALVFSGNVIGLSVGPLLVGMISDHLTATMGVDALRYALLVAGPLCIWSAFHYWSASAFIERDLDRPTAS